MSQNIDIWITRLWSNPFIPLSRRSRMKRNKEISWFLTEDFQCKLLSWEWSKMYIWAWQHMSSHAVLYYFPVILCHNYGRFLYVFIGIFWSSFETTQGTQGKLWELWYQPWRPLEHHSQLCLSWSKGHVCPNLGPHTALLPFIWLLSTIHRQSWRALFLSYSNLPIAFLLPHRVLWKKHVLKDIKKKLKNQNKNHQNQKITHQKLPDFLITLL